MHYDAFLQRICPSLDLEWRKYRRRAARRRVRERMAELGLSRFEDYLQRLTVDSQEAAELAERMRITISRFFREAERWKTLQHQILPQLLASSTSWRSLQVWSVGCAGGEEPYSLALLWSEYVQPMHPHRHLAILATDIDPPSLQRAEKGLYPQSSLREVPDAIREKYFAQKNEHRQLFPRLSARVRFRQENFLAGSPPGLFDLVMARYLPFTYYRGERRMASTRQFWRALRPGGALMIGAKEQLGERDRQLFSPWPGAEGFYRRKSPGEQRP